MDRSTAVRSLSGAWRRRRPPALVCHSGPQGFPNRRRPLLAAGADHHRRSGSSECELRCGRSHRGNPRSGSLRPSRSARRSRIRIALRSSRIGGNSVVSLPFSLGCSFGPHAVSAACERFKPSPVSPRQPPFPHRRGVMVAGEMLVFWGLRQSNAALLECVLDGVGNGSFFGPHRHERGPAVLKFQRRVSGFRAGQSFAALTRPSAGGKWA